MRLCRSLIGFGLELPEDPATALVALELSCPAVLALLVAAALWACIAAIRLWMNSCMACAGSEPVLLAEVLDELVEHESDVALVPEAESFVTPICDSACRMESISPPPGGGGGAVELTLDESVTSACVLVLVLELEASCASQLLRLDTLPIVM